MQTYIDCLPEEIIQHIWKLRWKSVYDECMKELPTGEGAYADYLNNIFTDDIPFCVTREIIKKTKDNVVLFHRNYFKNNDEMREWVPGQSHTIPNPSFHKLEELILSTEWGYW